MTENFSYNSVSLNPAIGIFVYLSSNPIRSGTVPLKEFPQKVGINRNCRFVKFPISKGNKPGILFVDKCLIISLKLYNFTSWSIFLLLQADGLLCRRDCIKLDCQSNSYSYPLIATHLKPSNPTCTLVTFQSCKYRLHDLIFDTDPYCFLFHKQLRHLID